MNEKKRYFSKGQEVPEHLYALYDMAVENGLQTRCPQVLFHHDGKDMILSTNYTNNTISVAEALGAKVYGCVICLP